MRGDGTRDGLGLTEGDPYCPEWQKRSREMKSGNSNSVEDWNASSLLSMTELQNHIRENEKDMIIVDRSILSRAAFCCTAEFLIQVTTYRYTTYIREILLLILTGEWILKKRYPTSYLILVLKTQKFYSIIRQIRAVRRDDFCIGQSRLKLTPPPYLPIRQQLLSLKICELSSRPRS